MLGNGFYNKLNQTRKKVDLRIPRKGGRGLRSTSPEIIVNEVRNVKEIRSYSPRLKNQKKGKKVSKEVLDYCFSRLEISMQLIRSVETKLRNIVNNSS